MTFDAINPPSDLLPDIESLAATVEQDTSGERIKRLVAYFAQAENHCKEAQLRATDFQEKSFAGQVGEAYAASSRIVVSAWQKKHGSELSV